ncbi:hypothetical protein MCHLDSM_06837 [Mycolicibacterium chlorophenolicum]|uniref:Uncharacterized protein n=1 Tax=Mycolicibacterium chlorophenolicum TaxID=37916 RepID=A0A0J6V9P3_9MYCO|nr:hypothetical protein MCHLDSM_06837 [Mycolicibacterium chlorophenolicum]
MTVSPAKQEGPRLSPGAFSLYVDQGLLMSNGIAIQFAHHGPS